MQHDTTSSQTFAKLLVKCRLRPVYRLVKFNSRYRMIIRNHWSGNFDGRFLIKIGIERQGWDLKVWQFGLFNFVLCLFVDSSAE